MESISSRLQSLFNELELVDDARRDPIRVVLQTCITDTRAAESNFGFPDLVKQNEELKSLLHAKQEEFDAYKASSESQRNVLRLELEGLLKEKAKRDESEKYPTLPREQFWILEVLPVESVGCLKALEIAEKADLPINEVDVHLSQILALSPNLANHTYDQPKNWKWFCTTAGTKYLMAVRADPEQLAQYERIPRLDCEDERLLGAVGNFASCNAFGIEMAFRGSARAGGASEDIMRRLSGLRGKGLIGANGLDNKQGPSWFILELGKAYFSEHRGPRPESKHRQ